MALDAFLQTAGADPVPCKIRSYVDKPNEVFDTYARMVGEIFIDVGGVEKSVNLWLSENGWGIPSFYSSMAEEKVTPLIDAANRAYEAGIGVWGWLAENAGELDFKLEFRGKGAPVQTDDGLVVPPKIFRRLAAWAVNRRAKMVTKTFREYLKTKKDHCFELQDFLEQGSDAATLRNLWEFIEADGDIVGWPEDLVFREASSRLVGAGGAEVVW
jgi:hypothetical protein